MLNVMRALVFFYLALMMILPGCSFYKSYGRKQFEVHAQERGVNTEIGITTVEPNSEEIPENQVFKCWQQPAQEPLWFQPTKQQLIVEHHDGILEVCFENNPNSSHP